jgi:hypothetical protein
LGFFSYFFKPLSVFATTYINMSNAAGDDKRRKVFERPLHPGAVLKETSSLAILEHYLYGKNVVRPVDMRNIKGQRTSDGMEANDNDLSSVTEGTVPV